VQEGEVEENPEVKVLTVVQVTFAGTTGKTAKGN